MPCSPRIAIRPTDADRPDQTYLSDLRDRIDPAKSRELEAGPPARWPAGMSRPPSIITSAKPNPMRLWASSACSGRAQQVGVAKFCQNAYLPTMSTMNISLPDSLKSFVDEQVAGRGYGTSSEYVRELIRADQDRQALRKLLLDGAASPATAAADETYFSGLRDRIRPAKSR
jgi:antitoxin ParD1/3/4